MKILHYALGFPPYRTGGLTKYCMDLMAEQKAQGAVVALLWPGKIGILDKKVRIKKRDDRNGIESFELINPLPVPLDEGIVNTELFIKSADKKIYEAFLKMVTPNVIHIHTLMGLHKEFLDVAEKLKIRTVFTTHDYFGLCPKVTLFRDGFVCKNDHDCADCVKCNYTALNMKKIFILQSHVYRALKDAALVKVLRKRHRNDFFKELSKDKAIPNNNNNKTAQDYQKLRHYYVSMLEQVDCIHYNSSIAEKVYEKYIHPKKSKVILITHGDIRDRRQTGKISSGKFRITYLGAIKPYKGFQILKAALDELWNEGVNDFELNLANFIDTPSPYMNMRDGYHYGELREIFLNSDFLIAPSIWYETFGFTVLEAMSYGVPVIVSDNVGAKDLIRNGEGIIIDATKEAIKETVLKLVKHKELCEEYCNNISRCFELPQLNDVEVLY